MGGKRGGGTAKRRGATRNLYPLPVGPSASLATPLLCQSAGDHVPAARVPGLLLEVVGVLGSPEPKIAGPDPLWGGSPPFLAALFFVLMGI